MQIVEIIERVPGVVGGYPIVADTRTPVRTIVTLYCETYPGDIDKVMESLPHLTREQVEGALDYYRAHPDIIDEDIARQRRATFAHFRPE